MTVAERWFYIPMVGILGMIGVIAQSIKAKPAVKPLAAFIVIIIIICFSLRTIVRNTNWNNALTLYNHDAKINKDSFDLENQLAGQLSIAGKYDEALIHAKRAKELEPHDARNWVIIGTIYMRQNKVKEGITYLRKAVDYDGGNYNAFYNLSYGYLLLDNPQEAKSFAEWGMKTYPQDANLLLFKAVAEYKLGDYDNALKNAEKAHSLLGTQSSNYIYAQILNKQPVDLNL
jgi:tetratricopeptide (TPR) repeat protein